MMIANVSSQTPVIASLNYGDLDSFAQLRSGNFLLSQFQIAEFRFFCSKPSHGRTIHVASKNTVDGKSWVRHLIGDTDQIACGNDCHDVMEKIEGDNSLLFSGNVFFTLPGLFSGEIVYDHPMLIFSVSQIVLIDAPSTLRDCDDANAVDKRGVFHF